MDKKINAYLILKKNPEIQMSEIDKKLDLIDTVRKWKSREFKEIALAEKTGLKITNKTTWEDIKKYNKSQKKNKKMSQKKSVTSQKKVVSQNIKEVEEIQALENTLVDPVIKRMTENDIKFTEKEKEFIRYYFIFKFNLRAAAEKAGYKNIHECYRLLKRKNIKRAIKMIKLNAIDKTDVEIIKEDLIDELHINLLRATGQIETTKVALVPTVKKYGGEVITLNEGTIDDNGNKKATKFKEIYKGTEIKTAEFISQDVKEIDLKEVVNTAKALSELYGFTAKHNIDYKKLELDKQRVILEKQKYGISLTDEEQKEIDENIELYDSLMNEADEYEN